MITSMRAAVTKAEDQLAKVQAAGDDRRISEAEANLATRYNAVVKVTGGGLSGQAGAVRHAIARALVKSDEGLRVPMRRNGFLTRDPRVKERKKYGLKRARKAPQYTKR